MAQSTETNRDGTHIRHELTSANDSDTAHREVLRRMETYGKDPDASDYKVARDTVLLLRALNHRVRHFKAQILADIKIREYNETLRLQSQTDTTPKARNRQRTPPSNLPPEGMRRSEYTHNIDVDEEEGSLPAWRPIQIEEVQPQTKSPTPGTTTSDKPHPSDADGSKSKDNDPADLQPQVSEITANQQQPQTPEYATTDGNGNKYTPIHLDRADLAQNIDVPRPKHTIVGTNTETGVSTTNEHISTVEDTAAYRRRPSSTQREPFPGRERGVHPPRRFDDKNTLSLETAGTTRHISQREHTAAMKTKGKLHIYRDMNLIPDRGKKPNESTIAKTKHEELSPELNDFCTYE